MSYGDCTVCDEPLPNGQGVCPTCLTAASELQVARIRALADHLETRPSAPSLEGYGLVDGLRAAAALLAGETGPGVCPDDGARDDVAFKSRVSLATLADAVPWKRP